MGVIFCVEPWNFPYYQLARVAGPHLMAGNVLLVKHAGIVPQCAIAFEKLLIEAGAPAGLYTNLLIIARAVEPCRRRPANQGRCVDRQCRGGQEHRGAGRDRTSRSPRWSLAAATRLSFSKTPISTMPSNGPSGDGCTTPAKPAARRSDSSSSNPLPISSSISSGRRSRPSSRATRWMRRRHSVRCPANRPCCSLSNRSTARSPRRKGAPGRQAYRPPGIVHGAHDPDGRQAGQPSLPR